EAGDAGRAGIRSRHAANGSTIGRRARSRRPESAGRGDSSCDEAISPGERHDRTQRPQRTQRKTVFLRGLRGLCIPRWCSVSTDISKTKTPFAVEPGKKDVSHGERVHDFAFFRAHEHPWPAPMNGTV